MIEPIKSYTHIVAFDNGVSANGIALFGPEGLVKYEKLPIKNELSYTKEEHYITRIDYPGLRKLLLGWNLPSGSTQVVMERAMINPARFRASMSAMRCLEAELIVIEELGWDVDYIDSKVWQHSVLPDAQGSNELKQASLELGKKLFPQFKLKKDADPLLIGYYWVNKGTLQKEKPKPKKEL
jgi:hypothetical protein